MNVESIFAAILVVIAVAAGTSLYRMSRKVRQVPSPTIASVKKVAIAEASQEYAHYACPVADRGAVSFWAF